MIAVTEFQGWLALAAFGVIAVIVAVPIWSSMQKKSRRDRLMAVGLDADSQKLLGEKVWFYGLLGVSQRDCFDGLMRIFIEEKRFEPCGGMESVTKEMKLIMAAQACLLVLGRAIREGWKAMTPYDRLDSILIYPSAFVARRAGEHIEDGKDSVLLGESWSTGSLILAWDSVMKGLNNREDGHNLVMHEFAHQLDQTDVADGVPDLDTGHDLARWARAFAPAYERLVDEVNDGRTNTTIDDYGATNAAEFFAVSVETFFEKPRQLRQDEPELYEQLKRYFMLDPEEWR